MIPTLTHRPYRDDRDLARMLALVSDAACREGVLAGHLPVGDVVWGLFQNPTIDPSARIRLFEDASGSLRGFVWTRAPEMVELHVDPCSADADAVLSAMVAWAEGEVRGAGEEASTIRLTIAGANLRQQRVARVLGYAPTGEVEIQLNHRQLDVIPEPTPDVDITVRPVRLDDPAEVGARVDLHREVWNSSRFTAEGYARLRTKPVYRPDLDLVAVTPEGELASYCILWWDPATRAVEFEPVGTAARFRGRGYGKTLILDALRRARLLGAREAIVGSLPGQAGAAARALYAAAGFSLAYQYELWEKTSREASAGAHTGV